MKCKNELLNRIMEMLPTEPRSYDTSDNPGFWTDGSEILCPSDMEAEVVADFLRDLLHGPDIDERIDIHTGYYDPYEDAKSGEQDDHTGFWYIDFD